MRRATRCLMLLLVAGLIGCAAPQPPAPSHAAADAAVAGDRVAELQTAMRKLWEDHLTYTRNYIISAVAGLPDADAVAARLLSNQDEIGDTIKPYYGEAAGERLSALLRDHIMIATEVVTAAKAGDQQKVAAAQQKWSDNGNDIAALLSGASPNWSRTTLQAMLQKHLDLTTQEVVSRLRRDWAADIRAYDEGHTHMLMFADALTDGIVRQFPGRFA